MIFKYHADIIRKYLPNRRDTVLLFGDQRVTPEAYPGTTEAYFRSLGFREVVDLDYNGKAKINHDLNYVVPANLHGTIDFSFDGGTLEHLANPGAMLESVVRCMRPGGVYIAENPMYPYGQAYWGVDPQIHHDFFRANGFDVLHQELYVDTSIRMKIQNAVSMLPDRLLDRLRDRVRAVPGAKEFIFRDPTRTIRVYRDGWHRQCYYFPRQTRAILVARRREVLPAIVWPPMGCYPPAK